MAFVGRTRVADGLVGCSPVGCILAGCILAGCILADCSPVDCILADCSSQDSAAADSTVAVVEVGSHAPEFHSDEQRKVGGWRDGNTDSFPR